MTTRTVPSQRLWSGPHGRVVVGVFSLAFLVAFESLAVATVMPVVADELDGLALYAISFAAPLAVGVVSMTVAGPLMDRHGPGPALALGVAVFCSGLVVAGLAPSMPVFLAGRAVQGLGMGAVGVGLYVVIGQVFPEALRPRVFTVLTSAWVLPALVGPLVAGSVAEAVGWRWVFLGVPVVAAASLLLIWPSVRQLDGDATVRLDHRRVRWAACAAVGILAVSVAGQRTLTGWPLLLVASLVLVVVFGPRLLPAGTWRGRRGLPSVIATRGVLGAALTGAEAYLPLSLVQHRGLSTTEAGLFLTATAVFWFGGAWSAAHLRVLASETRRVRLGSLAVLAGVTSSFLTLGTSVPLALAALVWALAGLGMGLALSTLSVLLLGRSAAHEQGANSAAMQANDAMVTGLALALGSVVFAAALTVHEQAAYLLVFSLAVAAAVVGVVLAGRLEPA